MDAAPDPFSVIDRGISLLLLRLQVFNHLFSLSPRLLPRRAVLASPSPDVGETPSSTPAAPLLLAMLSSFPVLLPPSRFMASTPAGGFCGPVLSASRHPDPPFLGHVGLLFQVFFAEVRPSVLERPRIFPRSKASHLLSHAVSSNSFPSFLFFVVFQCRSLPSSVRSQLALFLPVTFLSTSFSAYSTQDVCRSISQVGLEHFRPLTLTPSFPP